MVVLKDRFVSIITEGEIKEHKRASSRSKTKAEKIFDNKTTDEVVNAGINLAKKNKRKILTQEFTLEFEK